MKHPVNHRKIFSLTLIIILASAASLLGAGLRWAAARPHPPSNLAANLATNLAANLAAKAVAQGCSLNCAATVPATGEVGAAVAFTATATPSGCATAPTYEWNFGDNSPVSSQQNPSHVYAAPGTYNWALTTRVTGVGAATIETVAGGLGEGNPATQVSFASLVAVARDPQGRGVYVAEEGDAGSVIRFINLGGAPATIAGVTVAPGAVRLIAGGGLDLGENAKAADADLGNVTGLGASPNGQLLYFVNSLDRQVRAINVSASSVTVGGASIGSGNVGTLAGSSAGFGSNLNGLSVNPSNGDVYVADASSGVNKVFRITPAGAVTAVAGNGASTAQDDPLPSGVKATQTPLLTPRGVRADSAGNVFISDTGHGRIVKVDPAGNITLVVQFQTGPVPPNPYPSGLALFGGNLHVANGNAQTIMRVTGGTATVAGSGGTACDYSTSSCGDGGPGAQAAFNLLGGSNSPPLAGIESDGNGLFILDQSGVLRGRVRYLNLSASAVTIGGVTIGPNQINTIAGAGLRDPYDLGPATSASLNSPVGVAVTPQGNLFIADTAANRLRFVNRGASAVTIFAGTAAEQTVAPGQIVTVNKDTGGPGDGAPVNTTFFGTPQGLATTAQGLFIVDSRRGPNVPPNFQGKRTGLIRFVNTTAADVTFYPSSSTPIVVPPGYITTIAGGGTNDTSIGNGGFATGARLVGPSDVAISPTSGDLFIADVGNKAVRKVDRNTGVVTSLTLPAAQYTGLGFDSSGRLYVINADANTLLRETAQGGGAFNTLATGLSGPRDVAVDAADVAYVTNSGNHRIVQVTSAGVVSTLAGATMGFAGDGGPAASARLNLTAPLLTINSTTSAPETIGITVGPDGDLFFTDSGNHRVRRLNFAGGVITCVRTGSITINPAQNPAPTITGLNPNTTTAGAAAFMLTINGSNFINGSVVRWNGSDRTTNVVSATQLTAQITASDIATAGAANVTVFNPAPGGGVSNAATFAINNPAPALTSLSPNQATAGGAAFLLTINGSNFVSGSVAQWNGSDRTTNVVSSTQLTAQITAPDIATAGAASVAVFNPAPGGGLSNSLQLTINQPQPIARTVRVVNASGVPGGLASVPIELVSQGDENAFGFSLSYPAATLTNPQVAAGADATGGLLNVNTAQTAQGRLGIILALPAGQKFSAGARQLAVVTFTIASDATAGTVAINFADQPIGREIADVNAASLQSNYVSGVVNITPGFEGDVSPRPNGNDSVTIADWVLLGRFAARVDAVNAGSEFQRADCAPRSALGDGNLTLSDWVQGGRYSAGLDPLTPAGGPTTLAALASNSLAAQTRQQAAGREQPRFIQARASSGDPNSMTIYLDARGDENAISFSLRYDPSRLRFAGAELNRELEPGLKNASLIVNTRQIASGRIGLMLALPAGQSLRAGVVALLNVRFTIAPGGAPTVARVSFGDEPIAREAVDVYARPVAAGWPANGNDFDIAVNARAAVSVSAASFTAGALAPEAIVAAFGDGLATTTQVASALPLPFDLAGTRVAVRDSAGVERPAPLFFVSPSQVNYLTPAETAAGLATVTITSGDGSVFSEAVEIAPVAPGLFAANADGQGVAAAIALRVKSDGSASYEPVAQFDAALGRYVAAPVELGDEGDQVYLLLFGTGIRSVDSLASMKATVGGVEAQVTYAGAQVGFAGLDQANVRLPRSLAGRGEVNVNLMVDGRVTNTVKISIR
jgi:uncharacterized protein (TIGR03437 family)